eukprot:GHVT01078919.1.p1 GENE.GHVT01078919.1~~GHVT01078919.1.p1  ORF type:complete len:461 (+),score=59.21 GHVT01078919.1:415-1797(+)
MGFGNVATLLVLFVGCTAWAATPNSRWKASRVENPTTVEDLTYNYHFDLLAVETDSEAARMIEEKFKKERAILESGGRLPTESQTNTVVGTTEPEESEKPKNKSKKKANHNLENVGSQRETSRNKFDESSGKPGRVEDELKSTPVVQMADSSNDSAESNVVADVQELEFKDPSAFPGASSPVERITSDALQQDETRRTETAHQQNVFKIKERTWKEEPWTDEPVQRKNMETYFDKNQKTATGYPSLGLLPTGYDKELKFRKNNDNAVTTLLHSESETDSGLEDDEEQSQDVLAIVGDASSSSDKSDSTEDILLHSFSEPDVISYQSPKALRAQRSAEEQQNYVNSIFETPEFTADRDSSPNSLLNNPDTQSETPVVIRLTDPDAHQLSGDFSVQSSTPPGTKVKNIIVKNPPPISSTNSPPSSPTAPVNPNARKKKRRGKPVTPPSTSTPAKPVGSRIFY